MIVDEDAVEFITIMVLRAWVVAAGQGDTAENFLTMQRDRGEEAEAWVKREFAVFKRAKKKDLTQ
jgi:hypothetical protein